MGPFAFDTDLRGGIRPPLKLPFVPPPRSDVGERIGNSAVVVLTCGRSPDRSLGLSSRFISALPLGLFGGLGFGASVLLFQPDLLHSIALGLHADVAVVLHHLRTDMACKVHNRVIADPALGKLSDEGVARVMQSPLNSPWLKSAPLLKSFDAENVSS